MGVKTNIVAFEDALTMTGVGKFNVLAFMVCSSIIIGMASEIFSVSYLVPSSACELHTTSAQQGIVAAVPLVGIIMTSHVWGYLADTRGRKKTLVLSMTIAFITGALAAFSPNWIVLLLLKFCSSAAVSGGFALSLTLLSEYSPMKHRSQLILMTTSVFLAAYGFMAVIALPVLSLKFSYYIPYLNIHFNSWRLLDLIFALPAAVSAIGISYSYESPKYLLSVGKNEEALKVLRGIFSVNTGKDEDLYEVSAVVLDEEGSSAPSLGFWNTVKSQTLPMVRMPLLKDTLLLGCLSIATYICTNPFVVWSPYIMNAFMVSVERGTADLTLCQMIRETRNTTIVDEAEKCTMNSSAMLMVFGINLLLAVLNLFTSTIVNCMGRKSLYVGLQLICGITAMVINTSTSWVVSAMLLVIYNMGVINFGTMSSFIVDIFPTYVKAMAICVTVMMGRGSAIFGINWLKILLDENCEAGFYIFGSISICGAVVGLLLPSDAALVIRKEKLKEEFANKSNSKEVD